MVKRQYQLAESFDNIPFYVLLELKKTVNYRLFYLLQAW